MARTYEAFAGEPEYLELNRRFLMRALPERFDRVLDLACGTGTCGFLILKNTDCGPEIVGVDISEESLELAQMEWKRLRESSAASVRFVRADAASLPFASGTFDLVIAGNAIQLFDDKEAAIREVYRVLRDGGSFAFNTSFYAGTFVPGTERFYLVWVQLAYRYVVEQTRRTTGHDAAVPRARGSKRAFSSPWLSKEEYRELLARNGFTIRRVLEIEATLTEHSFQSIGSYTGLATVLLSGYPPELASEALEKSVGQALAMVQMQAIPRNWLEVIAQRG
jgi:ubiquinone/menaquinone biosynthesis C-methylase UbiE